MRKLTPIFVLMIVADIFSAERWTQLQETVLRLQTREECVHSQVVEDLHSDSKLMATMLFSDFAVAKASSEKKATHLLRYAVHLTQSISHLMRRYDMPSVVCTRILSRLEQYDRELDHSALHFFPISLPKRESRVLKLTDLDYIYAIQPLLPFFAEYLTYMNSLANEDPLVYKQLNGVEGARALPLERKRLPSIRRKKTGAESVATPQKKQSAPYPKEVYSLICSIPFSCTSDVWKSLTPVASRGFTLQDVDRISLIESKSIKTFSEMLDVPIYIKMLLDHLEKAVNLCVTLQGQPPCQR